MGPAVDALPYFILIFQELGRRGLGPKRGKYDLIRVDHLANGAAVPIYDGRSQTIRVFTPEYASIPDPVYADITQITLNFLTPLRLKEKGDLVTRLTFLLFFEHLAHRLALLAAFYGNNSPATPTPDTASSFPDFAALLAQAKHIETTDYNLRWYDWARYSSRQNAAMRFGGLKGTITFTGDLGLFMPSLRLGEQINIGQTTTFGLGRYELAKGNMAYTIDDHTGEIDDKYKR
jgi:hypothetical protein